jgi:hypothetical protein
MSTRYEYNVLCAYPCFVLFWLRNARLWYSNISGRQRLLVLQQRLLVLQQRLLVLQQRLLVLQQRLLVLLAVALTLLGASMLASSYS